MKKNEYQHNEKKIDIQNKKTTNHLTKNLNQIEKTYCN